MEYVCLFGKTNDLTHVWIPPSSNQPPHGYPMVNGVPIAHQSVKQLEHLEKIGILKKHSRYEWRTM